MSIVSTQTTPSTPPRRRLVAAGFVRCSGNPTTRTTPAAATPCGPCEGNGGRTVDTSSDGITRKTWHTCGTCRGTGTR